MKLPQIIVSSVIRSSHQGESHGGVYLVDCENDKFEQVVDWSDISIDWEGRGLDRGLRGIAFYKDKVLLAASDEIYVYDREFKLVESYKNKYLKHCHEIYISDGKLFMTSTGYDSVLVFDLKTKQFIKGYCLRYWLTQSKWMRKLHRRLSLSIKPSFEIFDPTTNDGPKPADTVHINNVHVDGDALYISGTGLNNLWCIRQDKLSSYSMIPFLTHNARPFHDGVLYTHTESNRILYTKRDGQIREQFDIKTYPESILLNSDLPKDHARQGFGRGLSVFADTFLIGGSSPATISVYKFGSGSEALKTINLSMDIRNAIHGLGIWSID